MDGPRIAPLVSLVAYFAFAVSHAAAQPPAEPRVARLTRELGAPTYADRVQAESQLRAAGASGKSSLLEALRSDDPEVRLRAKRLLDALSLDQFWSAGKVHYSGTAEPAAILKTLADQSGNRFVFPATLDGAEPITADYHGWEFWPAVDEVCRRANLQIRPQFDGSAAGLAVTKGPSGQQPLAYGGPLRLQISGARRAFSEDFDFENRRSDVAHTFQLNLQMTWENRFRLVAHTSGPEVVEAATINGEKIAAIQQSSSNWCVIGPSTRSISANVKLAPPRVDAQSLSVLHLAWPVVAVGDPATLELPLEGAIKVWQQDDLVLDVQKCERSASGRYELLVVVRRDLAVPDPPEVLFQENEFQLLDGRDEPLKLQGQSSLLTERGVEFKLSFSGDRDIPAVRLRFTYPRVRMRRTMDLVFHDVPLPAARPD